MAEAQQDDFPHEAIANTGIITDVSLPRVDVAMSGHPDGSFTVVWEGRKAGPDEKSDIKGQKLWYNGGPLGAEYMVNVNPAGNQSSTSIDISAGGMTAVVWRHGDIEDPESWDIQMRLMNPSLGFDQTVNAVEEGSDPKVCIAGGEPIIVWRWRDPYVLHPPYIIRAARFDSTGARKGGIIDVAHYRGTGGDHRLDCFESGAFAVSWWERDEYTQDDSVWFQIYDSSDEPMFPEPSGDCIKEWSENSGVCVAAPSARYPDILALLDGGVRVAYFDGDEGPIKISCFNEAAESAHLEFSVPGPGTALAPAISGDIDKMLIAWVARESGENFFRAALYDMTGDDPQAMEWDQFEGETHPTVSRFCPDPYKCRGGSIRIAGPDYWGNFVLAWSVRMDPENFPDNHDVMIRCFDENGLGFPCGVDVDGDGVLDMYDCDRLNPYLRHDLDSDGRCDGIIGGTLDDCLSACNRHKHEYHRTACEDQCENPDNCPCLNTPPCPFDEDLQWGSDLWGAYCRPYRDCINRREDDCNITHENEARECAKYFSNPGQHDGNENERGDRCESSARAHITRFEPTRWANLGKGAICWGEGATYNVETLTMGGFINEWGSSLDRRFHVGACGCSESQIADGSCTQRTFWLSGPFCPVDREKDQDGNLAWYPIKADEAYQIPQIHEQFPHYPARLSDIEPDPHVNANKYLVINKYGEFTHEHEKNRRLFTWKWNEYDKDGVLDGLLTRVRIAWQGPSFDRYTYYDPPNPRNHKVAYLPETPEQGLKLEGSMNCFSVPWEINHPLAGPGHWEEGARLIVKPWGYTDPYPPDPGPWLMTRDIVGDTHLVFDLSGSRMQLTGTGVAAYSGTSGPVQSFPAIASGMVSSALSGMRSGGELIPAVFQYGGWEVDGSYSRRLWVGFPGLEENPWRTAEEIWRTRAGDAPLVINHKMLHDTRMQRLVVIGDLLVQETPRPIFLPDQIVVFDLENGQWLHVGGFPVAGSGLFSITVDELRNRAVMVGPGLAPYPDTKVYSLDLFTLKMAEINATLSEHGPFVLTGHGAFLEPVQQALYVYGGEDINGPSSKAFKLDLISRQWIYLGDGAEGPGAREEPFVSYDRVTDTLWISGGIGGSVESDGVVFWGLRDGDWIKRKTLQITDRDDWRVEGVFDLSIPDIYPLYVDELEPYPGDLLLVHLHSDYPDLGLEVIDSKGITVGRDLAPVTDNYVTFHGHSVYGIRVVPGPGFDPSVRPRYTLEVSYGDLSHVADVSLTQGVNELMIHEGHAYLVGTEGMHAVSLADPVSPEVTGLLDLQGYGHDVAMCGRNACVAKMRRSESLKVVDISDPVNMSVVGGLHTPGNSTSIAIQGRAWAYLGNGGGGVSIVNVSDPENPGQVERMNIPGRVTAVETSGDRLYVGTSPHNIVRVYSVLSGQSPVYEGQFQVEGEPEKMKVMGRLLHVSLHEGPGHNFCASADYCPRGTWVEVFDVTEPESVEKVGEYDGYLYPVVHMRNHGRYVLVRTYEGFEVYEVQPLP